jgi:hypothetical protein
MNHEFAFLQLTREELVEMHRALLQRDAIEQTLRREQGLEPTDESPLLDRVERTLGLSADVLHDAYHHAEDELWEYVWFTYTDEWAWFRAKREVEKELGARAKRMSHDELDALIEDRYQKQFNRYAAEVDMHEVEKTKNTKTKNAKTKTENQTNKDKK